MDKKQGNIEAVSVERRGVKINDSWYDLADNIKIDFVRKGPCEFVNPESNKITFIKNTGSESQNQSQSKPESKPEPKPKKNVDEQVKEWGEQDEMRRMSASKSASRVFEGSADAESFEKLSKRIEKFIKMGYFE